MSEEIAGIVFYKALQKKAMDAVKDIFNSRLYPIQYPAQGDFMYNYQNDGQIFNNQTYGYIDARVSPGDNEKTTAKLSDAGGFQNAYINVIESIIFQLSNDDQKRLTDAQNNAQTQANTIISDYQATYGEITQQQMDDAKVETKLDYVISYKMGSVWSGRGDAGEPPLTWTEMQKHLSQVFTDCFSTKWKRFWFLVSGFWIFNAFY